MYLGAQISTITVRMQDGSLKSFPSGDLQLLRTTTLLPYGDPNSRGVPLRPDGGPFTVSHAGATGQEGDLWDGCPVQVALEELGTHNTLTFFPGQVEALRAMGIVPGCLVPGSPNWNAYHLAETLTPDSGSGRAGAPAPAGPGTPAILPTGVSTPGIIPQPGGGGIYIPPDLGPDDAPDDTVLASTAPSWDALPWLLVGILALSRIPAKKTRR